MLPRGLLVLLHPRRYRLPKGLVVVRVLRLIPLAQIVLDLNLITLREGSAVYTVVLPCLNYLLLRRFRLAVVRVRVRSPLRRLRLLSRLAAHPPLELPLRLLLEQVICGRDGVVLVVEHHFLALLRVHPEATHELDDLVIYGRRAVHFEL